AVNRSMGLPEKMVTHNVGIQRGLMQLIAEETNDDMLRVKLLQRLQGVYAALDSNTRKMVKEETFVNSGVEKVMSREFLSIIRHDPQHFYPKIKCPVLALNGTRDIQVLYDINL